MIITLAAVVAAVGLTLLATMASFVKQLNAESRKNSEMMQCLADKMGGMLIALRQLDDYLRRRDVTSKRQIDELCEFADGLRVVLGSEFKDRGKRMAMFSAHLAQIEDTLTSLRADVQNSSEETGKAVWQTLTYCAKELETPAEVNQEMEQLLEQALSPEPKVEELVAEPENEKNEKVFVKVNVMTVEERYRAMKQMKEDGKSLMDIAKAFGLKNRSSVVRFMQRNAKKFDK